MFSPKAVFVVLYHTQAGDVTRPTGVIGGDDSWRRRDKT